MKINYVSNSRDNCDQKGDLAPNPESPKEAIANPITEEHIITVEDCALVVNEFNCINKYDSTNILNYSIENITDADVKCNKAFWIFKNLQKEVIKEGIFTEDLLKVYIFTYQRLCASYKQFLSNNNSSKDSERMMIKKISELNKFLFCLLNSGKQCLLYESYFKVIELFLQKILTDYCEWLVLQSKENYDNSCLFLYHQCQAVYLIGFCWRNMKICGEVWKLSFDILLNLLKKSIGSIVLQEIFEILFTGEETWIPGKTPWKHLLISNGQKRLSIISIENDSQDNIFITLKEIILYGLSKLIDFKMESEETKFEVMVSSLKRSVANMSKLVINQIPSQRLQISAVLNENLVSMKCINKILQKSSLCFNFYEKYGFVIHFKNLVQNHLELALSYKLYAKGADSKTQSIDFVSKLFKTFNKGRIIELKHLKECENQISLLFQANFLFEVFKYLEQTLTIEDMGLTLTLSYLIEFAIESDSADEGKIFFKIMKCKAIKSIGEVSKELYEYIWVQIDKFLQKLLYKSIGFRRKFFEHCLSKIKQNLDNANEVRNACRLLHFSMAKRNNNDSNMRMLSYSVRDIFVELNGIVKLSVYLLLCYAKANNNLINPQILCIYKDFDAEKITPNESCIKMLEDCIIRLNLASLLKHNLILDSFLDFLSIYPNCSNFVITLFKNLLQIIREEECFPEEKDNYLPEIIVNNSLKQMKTRNISEKARLFPMFGLLSAFIKADSSIINLSKHQNFLYETSCINKILECMELVKYIIYYYKNYRNAPEAASLLIKSLQIIRGILFKNEALRNQLQNFPFVQLKKLMKDTMINV